MRIDFNKGELGTGPHGLEVAVHGFKGNNSEAVPTQIYLEVYDGKLQLHVWNGLSDDPLTVVILPC